jgi:hypothetical protein
LFAIGVHDRGAEDTFRLEDALRGMAQSAMPKVTHGAPAPISIAWNGCAWTAIGAAIRAITNARRGMAYLGFSSGRDDGGPPSSPRILS